MPATRSFACPPVFFFNDTATTEIYTLSLHDALPISPGRRRRGSAHERHALWHARAGGGGRSAPRRRRHGEPARRRDRKSTRLNSSHSQISYAVFCLKKKNKRRTQSQWPNSQAVDGCC